MAKSHFQKVVALWMFSWEFPLYLRAALPSESYTSRWLLWIELYTVISFHYCTVQRDRGIIAVFLFTMERKSYLKLIVYPILPTGNYAAHLYFLKTVRFVKLWAKKRLLWGREKRCAVEWHTVKLWVLEHQNSPYSLRERIFFLKGLARFYSFFGK